MIKYTFLGHGNFQIDDNELAVDEKSVINLLKSEAGMNDVDADAFVEELKMTGSKTANTRDHEIGVVVDMYEVDYPKPDDPYKETQEMVKHLDEYEDAVAQHLFPGVSVEDIVVVEDPRLRKVRRRERKNTAPPRPMPKATSSWRKVLSFEHTDANTVEMLNGWAYDHGFDHQYDDVVAIRHEQAKVFSDIRSPYQHGYVIARRARRDRDVFDLYGFRGSVVSLLEQDIDTGKVSYV